MINKTTFILLSLLTSPVYLFPAGSNHPIGGRSAGVGSASSPLSDLWSVHNNQAGLGNLVRPAAGIYYENRFLVRELTLKAVAFVLPTRSGTFGVSFNSFGYTNYNEIKAGLAYGKKLGKVVSAGVQLDYLRTHIAENYGNKDAFTFEAGIQAELTKQLTMGIHLFNPIRVKIEKETDDRVPAVFKLGMAYKVSDKLIVAVETEKDSEFKPLFRGGIEYQVAEMASARIGYSTLPSTSGSDSFSIASVYSFGFGLNIGKFVIDLSSAWHQTLGWSPMVSLTYNFVNNKK